MEFLKRFESKQNRDLIQRIQFEEYLSLRRYFSDLSPEDLVSFSFGSVRIGNQETLEFRLRVVPLQVPDTQTGTTPGGGDGI